MYVCPRQQATLKSAFLSPGGCGWLAAGAGGGGGGGINGGFEGGGGVVTKFTATRVDVYVHAARERQESLRERKDWLTDGSREVFSFCFFLSPFQYRHR